MAKDYYAILGVTKCASQDEIKKAFRKLAHTYHPDKKGGDEAKFKEVNEAYQVLGNAEKRQQYDQFGANFDTMGGGGGGFHWQDFAGQGGFNGGMNFDIGDIFSEMFGGRGQGFSRGFGGAGSRRQRRGNDIEADIEVEFMEAINGVKRSFKLYKTVTCKHCHGNGAEPGTPIKECSTCKGTGQIEKVQRTILGSIKTVATCGACHGEGKTPEKKCTKCGGVGYHKADIAHEVIIPPGIEHGQVIKLDREGEAGANGAPAGDLYIHVRIKKHPRFERRGGDIFTVEEITFPQAAMGTKIDVQTVQGEGKLKIPEGTQSGKVFKLRAKGAPRVNRAGNGDQYVKVVVKTPTNLTRKQKKILQEFDS